MSTWTKLAAVVVGVSVAAGCGDGLGPGGGAHSIVVSPAAPTLDAIGATQVFTAQALDVQGRVLVPQPTFAWRSATPDVADVDGVTGVVTAVGNGTTTITASVEGVTGGVEGSATLTVKQVAASIVVDPDRPTLRRIGATRTFAAQALDAQGQVLVTQPVFAWRSSLPEVATIDDATGVAVATGNGTTTITAAVAGTTGGVEGSTTLTTDASLSAAEKLALTNALASTEFGGLGAFVIQTLGVVGKFDAAALTAARQHAADPRLRLSVAGVAAAEYEGAVGIAIEYVIAFQDVTESGWFYGVFGWNDVDTTAGTVGEFVLVGASADGGTLPGSVSGTIESGGFFAEYMTSNMFYYGTTGSVTIAGTFGGSATDCSASQQGVTVDCAYTAGSMSGAFSFSAVSFTGTGTYDQSAISFANLPAVKVTIAITQ